jgi:transposase
MTEENQSVERVIGFDAHPDSFTAAALQGSTPAAAITEQVFNKLPNSQLERWAKKHTTPKDLIVMEASGNSFHFVRRLAAVERRAKVLESCYLGKLKEAHANNDKISAVRIGKAYLAGTAKEVWVPDVKTQQRRDLFHTHRKATKQTTRTRNTLKSYLSDNGVRLEQGTRLTDLEQAEETIRKSNEWSALQWQIIQGRLIELRHADEQRRRWRSMIAQEVLSDPQLLSIVRLCGARDLVAFALGAFIGDIKRFAKPKSLVKYFGLNPAFDDSGNEKWSGGIGGHGRADVRCLLIEGAQAILRCSKTPLALWGKKLLARKGALNLVVAAIARKLTVAVWYLLNGRWTPVQEIDAALEVKLTKIAGQIAPEHLQQTSKTRPDWRQEARERLKTGRVYQLDPNTKLVPRGVSVAEPAAQAVPS